MLAENEKHILKVMGSAEQLGHNRPSTPTQPPTTVPTTTTPPLRTRENDIQELRNIVKVDKEVRAIGKEESKTPLSNLPLSVLKNEV